MALSLQFPVSPIPPKTSVRSKPPRVSHILKPTLTTTTAAAAIRKNQNLLLIRAVEEGKEGTEEAETINKPANGGGGELGAELSELGSEIKKVLKEKKEEKEGDLVSGVAEEIREIEWPPFGKVLGTTGVVLGVIAGSSVVLLTVNFLLAELSDRVFAGRGIQDFFG